MNGIVGYGVYVPYWRLDRKAIADALGVPGGRLFLRNITFWSQFQRCPKFL